MVETLAEMDDESGGKVPEWRLKFPNEEIKASLRQVHPVPESGARHVRRGAEKQRYSARPGRSRGLSSLSAGCAAG